MRAFVFAKAILKTTIEVCKCVSISLFYTKKSTSRSLRGFGEGGNTEESPILDLGAGVACRRSQAESKGYLKGESQL